MTPQELIVWRKARHMSQSNLADRLGWTRDMVASREIGRTPMPGDMEKQLANVVGALSNPAEMVWICYNTHPQFYATHGKRGCKPNANHPLHGSGFMRRGDLEAHIARIAPAPPLAATQAEPDAQWLARVTPQIVGE